MELPVENNKPQVVAAPNLEETCLESTSVFRGKLLDAYCDRVRLPDGNESTREYVKHQGAVVILPVLESGELIFERQYRYPLSRVMIELPAGKIDPGEETLETAKRELFEETGYRANQWRYVGLMHPCVGYANERIEIFLAQGLVRESAQQLDAGEFIELLFLSLDDALNAIRQGEITDSKTITALFWVEKILRSNW